MDILFIYSFTHTLGKMFNEQPEFREGYQAKEPQAGFVSLLPLAPPVQQNLLPHCPVPPCPRSSLSVFRLTLTSASCVSFLLQLYFFAPISPPYTHGPSNCCEKAALAAFFGKLPLLSEWSLDFRGGVLDLASVCTFAGISHFPTPPRVLLGGEIRATRRSPDAYSVCFCLKCPFPPLPCRSKYCLSPPPWSCTGSPLLCALRALLSSRSKYQIYLWARFISVLAGALGTG